MAIPSDEDFARAKRQAAERGRNLDKVEENARRYFAQVCPFSSHTLFVMPEGDNKFAALVFYKNARDVAIYQGNGIAEKIEEFIFAELDRQGRGKRDEIDVRFEFDSDDNVRTNYEGIYFLRLR